MSQETVAVLNATSRPITLKAQVRNRKKEENPIKFKFPLLPGVMNMVPAVMWVQFKRNAVVQAMLDTGELITGRDAKKEEAKTEAKTSKTASKKDATQAALEALAANGDEK